MTAKEHWQAAAVVRRAIDALEAQALQHESRAYMLESITRHAEGDVRGAGHARGLAYRYAELADSALRRSRGGGLR